MGTVLSTKTWVWCGGTQPCEERDGDTQVTQRFFAQGFQTLAPYSSLPASFYYTQDHLGSVREVVDATGTLRARYDYDAWGHRTKLSGDVDADIGFTGHLHHKPTGLILTLCRAYDPRLGRWLSRDPIAERGGINLYGCVGNDPVNLRDPTGEAALPGAIVGALTSIGIQILEHNGNIKCVNWKTVAVDSAMGATGVGLVKNVTKLKSLKRAIDNVEKLESSLKHVGSDAAREYLEKKAKQDAMKATGRAAGLSAGQGLKNSIKENDCECPDNEE